MLPGVEVRERQWEGGDGVQQQVLADAERDRDCSSLPREGNAEVSPELLLTHKSLKIELMSQDHQHTLILKSCKVVAWLSSNGNS